MLELPFSGQNKTAGIFDSTGTDGFIRKGDFYEIYREFSEEKNAVLDAYPEEEFFETETDMTEFEGKLEDFRA